MEPYIKMRKFLVLFLTLTLTNVARAEMPENIMIGNINLLQAIEIRNAYDREREGINALYNTPQAQAATERNRLVRTTLSQRNIKGYDKVYDKHKHILRPIAEQIADIHTEMQQTARNVTPENYQQVLNIFYEDTYVNRAKPLIEAYMEASNKVLDEIERDYL